MTHDYTDIVGGLLLVVIGGAFSLYASGHYDLGTISRMGPGMFPAALGAIMVVLGLAIAIPAFMTSGVMPQISLAPPFFVLAGIAAFALSIRHVGLIPAIVLVTVISSFAEYRLKPIGLIALCAFLCTMTYVVFSLGLGLSVPVLRWPS